MSLLRREMINVKFKHIIKFSSTSTKPLEYVVYIGISESGSDFFSLPLYFHFLLKTGGIKRKIASFLGLILSLSKAWRRQNYRKGGSEVEEKKFTSTA